MRNFVLIISVLFVMFSASAGAVVYVPADYSTIQQAVDNSPDGETIVVSPGTYSSMGDYNVVLDGRTLTIQGSVPGSIVIDPQGQGRGFIILNGSNVTIQGLTIQNGIAKGDYFVNYNAHDSGESATPGGGAVIIDTSSANLYDCFFQSNVAQDSMPSTSVVDGGSIDIINGSSANISDCVVQNSTATHSGGGIHTHNSEVYVRRSIVEGNLGMDSTSGGGLAYTAGSTGSIINCLIIGNRAWRVSYGPEGGGGAGILCFNSNPLVFNNTIVGNSTWYEGNPGLGGGGISVRGFPNPVIKNNIIWWNASALGKENIDVQFSYVQPSDPRYLDMSHCCIENWDSIKSTYEPDGTRVGMLQSDPLFVDPSAGDYTLQETSPCKDAGTTLLEVSQDFFGTSRPQGSEYDIGYYEIPVNSVSEWQLY